MNLENLLITGNTLRSVRPEFRFAASDGETGYFRSRPEGGRSNEHAKV
jgi:hypothetical protein